MRHPLITQHQLGGPVCDYEASQIQRRPKIDKALVSVWVESTTCFEEFCDSEHVQTRFSTNKYVLCASSFAHDLVWKGSTNVLGRNDLSHRLPPTSKPNQLVSANSPIPCPSSFQTQLTPSQSRLCELIYLKSNIQMPYLSSPSDIKGSTNYICFVLLAHPSYSRPPSRDSSHVIHATLQHLFSHHTTRSSQTDNLKVNFLTKM